MSASRSASSSLSRARIEASSVSLFSAIWLNRLAPFPSLSIYTVPARQSNRKNSAAGENILMGGQQAELVQGVSSFRRNTPARNKQICHKALIHIKIAFIFPKVANRMTFIQHAPHFRTQSERVGQCLKDVVTIGRPISIPTQGCQTKRVRGVVGKIKAAFQ